MGTPRRPRSIQLTDIATSRRAAVFGTGVHICLVKLRLMQGTPMHIRVHAELYDGEPACQTGAQSVPSFLR